ncbi:MAG: hypothetical protein ACRD5W_02995, partial [Candidatus Acidiferrales bacterium]
MKTARLAILLQIAREIAQQKEAIAAHRRNRVQGLVRILGFIHRLIEAAAHHTRGHAPCEEWNV